MIKLTNLLNENNPCWDGYKVGNPRTKISSKTGKRVNNCVPVEEGLEDTSWTGEKGQKITLQQLLGVIKDYPIIQAPIEKIKKIIIKKDSGGIESDRLSTADIKYPIIIVVDDSGNYKYILDGNHRANKAINSGLKSIPAKLVNIKKLPQEFQDVLSEAFFIGEGQDIKCEKCGWEWNTEDSDESDKYICHNHNCGFDNSYKYNIGNVSDWNKKPMEEEIDEYDVDENNLYEVKDFIKFMKEYQSFLAEAQCDCVTEAEYKGRKVALGKPMQGDIKKFKVYVKNNKGKVVKVNFGFGGKSAHGKRMVIKRNNSIHRNAYRKRHHCDNPGPRWKANYWSCRKW
jgi:hypothetical protein